MKFRILASLGLLFLATPAFAQAKDLVGSWTLVSSTVRQGANTLQPFGADPRGALIFRRRRTLRCLLYTSPSPRDS